MSEVPELPTPVVRLGILERSVNFLAKLSLVAMMVIIGGEVVLRNTFHHSWPGTDEVSGYLVVAITFLSLAVCQAHKGYHELQVVKGRLSPRAVALLDVVLNLICLVAALILLWQFSRLVMRSWETQDLSSTALRTPYWIPQVTMPLGMAAFCIASVKEIALNIRLFRTPGLRVPPPSGHELG